MAFNYEFIDEGKSLGINFNGQGYTAGKNLVELTIPNLSDNDILKIRSNSATPTEFIVKIGIDTVTGVGAGSTTATELKDSLKEIFFLNEGSSGGVGDHFGFLDFNDSSTAASPVTLSPDVWTDIPNDKQGAFSNTGYGPEGVTSLMDGNTGYLDFTQLTLGSDVMIRIDFIVTPNTNNSLLETRYVLGQGAGEYALPVRSRRLDSGSGIPYSSEKGSFYIYMGDQNTLGGVGKLQVKLSTPGTLVNNGVAIKIYKK